MRISNESPVAKDEDVVKNTLETTGNMKKRNKKAYIGTQKKQKIDRKLAAKMPTRYAFA